LKSATAFDASSIVVGTPLYTSSKSVINPSRASPVAPVPILIVSAAPSNLPPSSVRNWPAFTTAAPVAIAMPPAAAPTASALTLIPSSLPVACSMDLPRVGLRVPAISTIACSVLLLANMLTSLYVWPLAGIFAVCFYHAGHFLRPVLPRPLHSLSGSQLLAFFGGR